MARLTVGYFMRRLSKGTSVRVCRACRRPSTPLARRCRWCRRRFNEGGDVARDTAYYSAVRLPHGQVMWKCSNCEHLNRPGLKVCRGTLVDGTGRRRHCARLLRKRPKAKRPARGSMERVALELKAALAKSAEHMARVVAHAKLTEKWAKRARHLQAKLDAGPQAPKPRVKRERPLRAMRLYESGGGA